MSSLLSGDGCTDMLSPAVPSIPLVREDERALSSASWSVPVLRMLRRRELFNGWGSFKPLEEPLRRVGSFSRLIGKMNKNEGINLLTADQCFRYR